MDEQMGDFQRGKNGNYKNESNKYAKNKSMVVKRKNSFNRQTTQQRKGFLNLNVSE